MKLLPSIIRGFVFGLSAFAGLTIAATTYRSIQLSQDTTGIYTVDSDHNLNLNGATITTGGLTSSGALSGTTITATGAFTGTSASFTSTSTATALGSTWNVLEKNTLSATGIVSGNGRGGRREMNLSGTVTGGAFIMGGQDKLLVTGTMNHADSRLAAGFSQLDGSAGTFTAGQLSTHWFDWGATAPAGGWNTGGQANTVRFQNTTASNVNSHLYVYGKADYLGEFSNNSSAWIDAGAHGATAAGRIKILVNGAPAYLHVFSD